jgi:hypothetical protein
MSVPPLGDHRPRFFLLSPTLRPPHALAKPFPCLFADFSLRTDAAGSRNPGWSASQCEIKENPRISIAFSIIPAP